LNRGGGFHLGTSHFNHPPAAATVLRPQPPRWHTHASDTDMSFARSASAAAKERERGLLERAPSRMDVDQDSLHDSAYVSSESKRNSEASLNPPAFTGLPRFESPRPMDTPVNQRTLISKVDDRHPRLSMVQNRADPPSPGPHGGKSHRAETVPTKLQPGPAWIGSDELTALIEESADSTNLLLLDLRGSQVYSHSRIEGALNLCIPTTLLKRPLYNLQKLQQTFAKTEDQERFANWREATSLVVYDSYSSEKQDALACTNMIKKFTNEGFAGRTCILRGGFNAFAEQYPDLIDERTGAQMAGASSFLGSSGGLRAGMPPVIGGVALPQGNAPLDPFFSNIRQNMDLINGVGQRDIARPRGLDSPSLPQWLRHAVAVSDHGKQVADKFLRIEKDEQSRMKTAYSMFSLNARPSEGRPTLCGIEKGGKNRYKDILPFEHARVKLQDRAEGACDYVNASHIKASRSNKRYIATQGPLPATFDVSH